ncbi:MAG: tetratricopeptide repeat protein, partial [Nitrospiraceae bacterium]
SSSSAMSESLGKAWPEQREGWQRAARAAIERATDLEPFNPFYRLELARIYVALGMPESAQTTIQRAVHIEPNFLPGRELLARLYLGSKQIEEAKHEHREILERQQRYANWTKGVTEKAFLNADVTGLEAALDQGRLDT